MTTIQLRSDFDVILLDKMGDDLRPVIAARTSTQGIDAVKSAEAAGLINRLTADRHGVPFEHAVMSWIISAPIFVWREFMRHRIGWSYSEESARYRQLEPIFYVPDLTRPAIQVGKPMDYQFEPIEGQRWLDVKNVMQMTYQDCYNQYEWMLVSGIAREVARMVLPVSIYSTALVTGNLRSIMHFLSLRVKSDESTYKSNPQWEINRVADAMERDFAHWFPVVHRKFCDNGRVQP